MGALTVGLVLPAAALYLIAALLAIWADRARGTGKDAGRVLPPWAYSAALGACYAYMLRPEMVFGGFHGLEAVAWFAACGVLCAIGTSGGGWGNVIGPILTAGNPVPVSYQINPDDPTGPKIEKDEREKFLGIVWQRGPFLRSAPLAALARGALWGACFAPAALLDARALLLTAALPAAFVAAPYIARRILGGPLDRTLTSGPAWAAETVRSNEMWALQEKIRAGLVSALIFSAQVVFVASA